jgi:hypothetical protein
MRSAHGTIDKSGHPLVQRRPGGTGPSTARRRVWEQPGLTIVVPLRAGGGRTRAEHARCGKRLEAARVRRHVGTCLGGDPPCFWHAFQERGAGRTRATRRFRTTMCGGLYRATRARLRIAAIWPSLLALVLGLTQGGSAAEGRVVCVRTVKSDAIKGTLVTFKLDAELVLRMDGQPPVTIPAADVVQIDTGARRTAPHSTSTRWVLANGDSLNGRLIKGSDRTVIIQRNDLGAIELPITRLREVVPPAGQRSRAAAPRMATTSRPVAKDDELWLANGDRLKGLIERIDPGGLTVQTDLGRTVVKYDVLLLARFGAIGPIEMPNDAIRSIRARLTLSDGSTLTVSSLEWQRDELVFTVAGAERSEPRQVKAADVLRVEVPGGRWQWLTDLTPLVAEHTGLLDLRWPHQINRNVMGGPLRIGGQVFEKGIGVHSRSRLVYQLGPNDERFVSAYGIDDDSGPIANVEAKILLDGKAAYQATDVRADGQVHRVSIDLHEAKQLELLVDYGKNGDVQDRFDWIEPAIIRR